MAVIRPAKFSKDSELIAAIDIGASKAVCLIARLAPSRGRTRVPEIIGVGRFGEAVGERAQANAQSAETALRGAVDAAERMAGERIRGVTAAMSGRRLACRQIGVDLDIEGGRVTQEDITDCMRQGAAAAAVDGAAPVHALPISYAIDGEDSMGDPTGLAGSTLTAEILGVSARERHVVNLEALIERCGLKLDDLVAAPLAAAEAVLVEDERELGAILLDIGARSTDFAVFERGALVACGGVPLGGEHVTRDIAHAFGAPLKDAERIKTLYGAALIGAGDENKLVNVPQLGDEDEFVKVSRAELSAVIAPRLEEIFELAAERLPSDARARHGVRRLILTGGGSLLVGAREMAERVLKMKTRLGRPAGLAGAPDAATAPQFSVCAGLIQLAVKQKAERADLAAACRPPVRTTQGGLLAGVGQWLRENF